MVIWRTRNLSSRFEYLLTFLCVFVFRAEWNRVWRSESTLETYFCMQNTMSAEAKSHKFMQRKNQPQTFIVSFCDGLIHFKCLQRREGGNDVTRRFTCDSNLSLESEVLKDLRRSIFRWLSRWFSEHLFGDVRLLGHGWSVESILKAFRTANI